MNSEEIQQNTYDQFADQYAQSQKRPDEETFSWNHDLVIPQLLNVVGDVKDLTVMDAGCGEGIVSRYLADRGAKVVAMDVSPPFNRASQSPRFSERY